MRTLVFTVFLIISFPVLFSACQEEEKLDIVEEKLEMEVRSKGDAKRWLLEPTLLCSMFKFDNTLSKEDCDDLVNNFYSFLDAHGPFRRLVYEIFQAIGNDEYKKININVNPGHSGFRQDNPPYALYDYETHSIIFPSRDEAKGNTNSLLHELIHHWQNLVVGKKAFNGANLRNTEFEVVFLLDVMLVKNEEDSLDTNLIQYFQFHLPQTAYTEDQKREYLKAINTTLNGNVHYIEDKLELFAKNFKAYSHVGYTPKWGFAIVDRLLNRNSPNYIQR